MAPRSSETITVDQGQWAIESFRSGPLNMTIVSARLYDSSTGSTNKGSRTCLEWSIVERMVNEGSQTVSGQSNREEFRSLVGLVAIPL